jgi:PAS domain-containing protein
MLGVVSETRSDEAPAASSGSPHLPSAELESTASGSSALAEAAALGLPALAGVVAGTEDGITVVDAERRFVYANPAACEMNGLRRPSRPCSRSLWWTALSCAISTARASMV